MVRDQEWATYTSDGRHYYPFAPMEVFAMLGRLAYS